ncbi:MAG: hypothetical protein IJ700_08745 [Bacteroidaceae bacterium]|nr:hypothetical protein [Bacteroidaceae bacterium]MBR1683418.1 hypothetical protein [Bacteroidaceae bacterium]
MTVLLQSIRSEARRLLCILSIFQFFSLSILSTSCERKPLLHLYDEGDVSLDLPIVDLDLQVYWDYEIGYDITYDWRAEWYYGWDETDQSIFGPIGYTEPSIFELRRYYTGDTPLAPHNSVLATTIAGHSFQGQYEWGFWDILVWNQVYTLDGVQSLHFDEESTLDQVTAYTNPSMHASRYHAPRYTQAFYEPEPLFAAYDRAIEINRNLDGFIFDEERNVWVKTLGMELLPITYIYLPQIILHHNNGRITSVQGDGNISGMARTTVVNTGQAGPDAIAVYFHTRMKPHCDKAGEDVDIIGGRLMTFGITNTAANRISRADDLADANRHYLDVTMQFNNGMDSTFVFDVTRQVRQRYKGGVITVELDMDTVPIPRRRGGSGFDAVVKDFEDGGTHEFEM